MSSRFIDRQLDEHAGPENTPVCTTLVDLTWQEGRIEHWLRFGHPICERIHDHHHRTVGFASGDIFAFMRWVANEYGTIMSRIDILRGIARGEPYQVLPCIRPGADILLRLNGWPKVERVLQLIDGIEALGIDPADAAPEYWRHVHNRLNIGVEPRDYTADQHRAWLARRRILS
ncbi:DUF2840 domain-containing protein [Paracoccus onubensis]|uniref:DUF2840 domain-containing protein n=1 Tax=Paracoccus onubensis TaxID=1675788 RepID=UPI0027300B0B|nr:DUF2840 domain-containing protein [Paracoccus onubensis]MDP0926543.1 DUF2840 domain-containing protein [Paracoccus onubensis]